jgi:hypothetical protein
MCRYALHVLDLGVIKIEIRQLGKTPSKSNEVLFGVFRSFMPTSRQMGDDGKRDFNRESAELPRFLKVSFVSIKFEKILAYPSCCRFFSLRSVQSFN